MKLKSEQTRFDLAELERKVDEQAAKREQRRKELLGKRIDAEERIVAWVDILGFSNALQRAQSEEEYYSVYRKMLMVHDYFALPSASDEPEQRQEMNDVYGRSVLALSDGLVITASAKAPASIHMTPYDLLMSFIGEIIMAQACCAANGIFLRGGISVGPFYYQDNILLSPALVRAYILETEKAQFPIIIIDESHVTKLKDLHGRKFYAEDADPSLNYFQPLTTSAGGTDGTYLFLDYLNFLADPGNCDVYSAADRAAYLDTSRPSEERNKIMSESYIKSAARQMLRHKQNILSAYRSAKKEDVRAKYRWLAEYQNRTLQGYVSAYDGARILPDELEAK